MPLFRFNLLFFVLLAVVTLLTHFFVERFQPTGNKLLTAQWQTKISDGSQVDIDQEHIRIFSDNPHDTASAFQFLQPTPHNQLVSFSAEIRSDDIIRGEKPWHTGMVSITQKIGNKKDQFLSISTTSLTGTNEWKKYQDYFHIPAKAVILFSIELYKASGSFEARNIQLYPVEDTQAYLWSKNIILLLWIIFFILLTGSCYFAEQKSIFLQFLLIVFFVLIVIGTGMQGDLKESIFHTVYSGFSKINPTYDLVNRLPLDLSKVGHFVFFFGLGCVLQLMIHRKKILEIFTVILMLACGTELIQIYIDGRTPHISDVVIDFVGGTLGIILTRLFRSRNNTLLSG